MQPLAILGGTFDPVHHGHLRVAWEASEQLDCELRLLPSATPPHRDAPAADAVHRVAMLRLALAGQSQLGLELAEIERGGRSYMVDTLTDLRRAVGPERPLILVLGADAFAGLSSWHRWTGIFGLAHIAVMTRPGHEPAFEAELAAEWFARRVDAPRALAGAPAGRIAALSVSALAISASAIRALLAEGRSPRYLVPERVLDYIVRHGLYRR